MWKKDEAVRPPQPTGPAPTPPVIDSGSSRVDASRKPERDMVNIGKSVVIKGELSGSEDLMIEGQVEGKIELRQNILTIGPNAKIKAQVFAKAVIVQGEIHGNVTATEKVDIRDAGSVDGDISAPRVAIADGAHFRGSIDMQRQGAPKPGDKPAPAETKPPVPVGATPGSPTPPVR
jgi:cytoskeletal protein CcmA (bactofilin family)